MNRLGNGEIRQYGSESVKSIAKGKYKKFLPAENYIIIQKIKYSGSKTIGSNSGYVLEIDEKNPFITDAIAQSILLKMQGFTFIPYTYQATIPDFAMDVGDKFDITNTNNKEFLTYIMGNSWEFNGAVSQTWSAKGENELNNTYSSKGPITQQIEKIINEDIPSVYDQAVEKATELITEFNGGYVIKKDGELFIADNEDIDKAQHLWRWNINGLGYSSTGIDGPYGLAITMNGAIVADFITTGVLNGNLLEAASILSNAISSGAITSDKIAAGAITASKIAAGAITADMITAGTMTANRIKGGTLILGGSGNGNGIVDVKDASGNTTVKLTNEGVILSNGAKLIGGNGVLSTFQFEGKSYTGFTGFEANYSDEANKKVGLTFEVFIPDNFVITSAVLRVVHAPIYWNNNGSYFWGYSRNLNLYKVSNINYLRELSVNSGFNSYYDSSDLENTGSINFTATTPTTSSHNTQVVSSSNFASKLSTGYNKLALLTSEAAPTYVGDMIEKQALMRTADVTATIIVIGYMK